MDTYTITHTHTTHEEETRKPSDECRILVSTQQHHKETNRQKNIEVYPNEANVISFHWNSFRNKEMRKWECLNIEEICRASAFLFLSSFRPYSPFDIFYLLSNRMKMRIAKENPWIMRSYRVSTKKTALMTIIKLIFIRTSPEISLLHIIIIHDIWIVVVLYFYRFTGVVWCWAQQIFFVSFLIQGSTMIKKKSCKNPKKKWSP